MSIRWDLAVYDKQNTLSLVIEAKTKLSPSADWAARLRRNMLAHGRYPKVPYFLLAFPDKFYLWINAEITPPTYEIDANPILQPYFEQAGVSPDQISGSSFELLLASWLHSVMQSANSEQTLDKHEQWLISSGLYEILKHGSLEYEVLA